MKKAAFSTAPSGLNSGFAVEQRSRTSSLRNGDPSVHYHCAPQHVWPIVGRPSRSLLGEIFTHAIRIENLPVEEAIGR
jgi:hypothetical protein